MSNEMNEEYKAGFVAVVGRPNVGKSTLMNALLGQKVAAVSPRPQTTRRQQLGILTLENAQMVFTDTPGIHKPHHKLGGLMNDEALQSLESPDVILFLVDASVPPHVEDRSLADTLKALKSPPAIIAVMNKMDNTSSAQFAKNLTQYDEILPKSERVEISALLNKNLDMLKEMVLAQLPLNPAFFPDEQVTDLFERDIAADLIREAALNLLKKEVPHAMAVRIDEFTERGDKGAYIQATLFIERESQKGIVIGKGGMMLKQIGTAARKEIEAMSGRKVFLKLRVKQRKNWRNDDSFLQRFNFRKRGQK